MKKTKSALLSSVVSLFLCFAMLLSTTFAWFTDSVKSENNVIMSGNLDIELEYWNGTEWVDVAGKSNILTNELWEPGVTEVAYLRVANAGSLALKYQLGINIVSETEGVNVAGDRFKLSDYIMFGVVEGVNGETGAYANREAAVEAVGASKKISAGYTNAGSLAKESAPVYLALVVYMPTTVGNEANHNGTDVPEINLGINVFATQLANEEDSFGSGYDEGATVEVSTADDLQAALNTGVQEITLVENITVDEPIVIPAPATATYSLRSTPTPVVIDLNGKKITTAYNETTKKHAYAIDNYGNLELVGGTIEARGIYNQKGATMTVNGTKIVNLDTNGGSCIWSYGGKVTLNNATLIGYTGCVYSDGDLEINGGTYTCYSAVLDDGTQLTPTYNIRSNGSLVINGGTFTSRHGLVAVKGSAVINGGTFTMESIGVITSHVIYAWGTGATVTVNGGEFNCDLRTAHANGSSMICVDGTGVAVNLTGGIFNLTPAKYVAEGYKAVEKNGKYVVVSNDVVAVIETAEDLLALSGTKIAGVYELIADIDLGAAEFKAMSAWYASATFNGNGHTISNAKVVSGDNDNGMEQASIFFVSTNGALTVSDLTLKDLTVETKNIDNGYAAAVVGYCEGKLVLNNVDVVNASVTGSKSSGMLVGHLTPAGSLTADGCDVAGSITISSFEASGHYAGEYVGTIAGDTTLTDCTAKVTLGGNLMSTNNGTVYGRKLSCKLTIDGIQMVNAPITVAPAPLEEDFLFPAGTNAVMYKNMNLSGDAQIVHTENAVLGLSNVKADLDHDVIVRKSGGAICIADCEFTLAEGAKLIVVGEGGDAYQVFMVNVNINGKLMDSTTIWNYVEGISYISIVSEWPNEG